MSREIRYGGGIGRNVSEAYGSRKPDLCQEKFVTTETQGKMCPTCVSRKNSTRAMRNLSRRCNAKCV
ncbi:hypothetical protein B296_00040885 [Ensete ventricosum]|uniref:Uncharacterized protein n=1 Tax=Ensete ventricosum TaxID=4639 RepID=A0A426Z7U7_ENSVE|nr:hypothetical protein B296_00040885 [Ensete ventricosum]